MQQKSLSKRSLVVLNMLVGNEWRKLTLTHHEAKRLVSRTAHRGYSIEPVESPSKEK